MYASDQVALMRAHAMSIVHRVHLHPFHPADRASYGCTQHELCHRCYWSGHAHRRRLLDTVGALPICWPDEDYGGREEGN